MTNLSASRRLRLGCAIATWMLATLVGTAVAARAQTAPAGTVRYYHTDALGSIRAVTDAQGHIVARHDYFSFGDGAADSADASALRFTGQERDRESGMDYFGARYLANRAGRFTTADPDHVGGDIFDPQSWNAYAYARNNPLRFIDPKGTEYEVCEQNAGCSVVSDAVWDPFIDNAGWGFNAYGQHHDQMRSYTITAWINGRWVFAGSYTYLGPDQPRTFNSMIQVAHDVAEPGVNLAVGVGIATTAIPGAVIAGGAAVVGGGMTTLAGEQGVGLLGNQAINQMIGAAQRELLREFFRTGRIPNGISERTLRLYKELAERAIAENKDALGVQAQRLQAIAKALRTIK